MYPRFYGQLGSDAGDKEAVHLVRSIHWRHVQEAQLFQVHWDDVKQSPDSSTSMTSDQSSPVLTQNVVHINCSSSQVISLLSLVIFKGIFWMKLQVKCFTIIWIIRHHKNYNSNSFLCMLLILIAFFSFHFLQRGVITHSRCIAVYSTFPQECSDDFFCKIGSLLLKLW